MGGKMMEETYRDPAGRARAATIVLAVFMVCDVLLAASEAYTIRAIDGFQAGTQGLDALERSDQLGGVTGISLLVLTALAATFSARWILRVNRNAQQRSEGWMTVSPRWNVGAFFVPFANLLIPFRGLRETFQVSVDRDDPEAVAVPVSFRIWWAAWLAMGVAGQISFRLSMKAETLEQLRQVSVINLFTTPLDLLAASLFIGVIWRITRLQRRNLSRDEAGAILPALA